MAELLIKLLGKDSDALPEGAETSLVLTNAPTSWQVFLLLAVIAGMLFAVVYLYRKEQGNVPSRWRLILATVRSLAVLCLLLIFLGPALGVNIRQTLEPYVIVLADDSHSMAMIDRYRDARALKSVSAFTGRGEVDLKSKPPTRIELVNELFQRDEGAFVKSMAKKGKVQVMSFADRLRLREAVGAARDQQLPGNQEVERGGPIPPLSGKGPATNIGRALRESVQSVAGNKIAAVVLISDGRDTGNQDAHGIADEFRKRGIPIFTVPVGDPSEPKNLRVTEMWAPESVPQQDPFIVQAQLQSRNLDAGRIQVELLERLKDDAAEGTVVARKAVTLSPDQRTFSLSFSHKPTKAGTFVYTVRAPVLEEELLSTDNERQAVVRVLDQKARILLIAGAPSWDYRMVRNLLVRDKTVDVSCWLQAMDTNLKQDGNTKIDRLPRDAKDLFAYDGIIFMDPNPNEFGEAWVEMIKKFAGKHGGGIFWQAGPKFTAQFLQSIRGAGIREVVPVRIAEGASAYQVSLRRTWTKEWPLRLRGSGVDHPMLILDRDPKMNIKLWERMPGTYWTFRVEGAKPGAKVLLEHTNPAYNTVDGAMPLLVSHQYGPGRVLFLGFGDTWRWRRAGEEHFDRFWVQAVRELASGRHMRGRSRGQIMTDRDRYGLGERVQVTGRLYDGNYEPLLRESVEARVLAKDNEEEKIVLQPLPGRPGTYEATLTARYLGTNEIVLQMPATGGFEGEKLSRRFAVEVPNIEAAEPQLNRLFLEQVAEQSGGAVVPLEEAANLADKIPNRRESLVVKAKPIDLWDNWPVLVALIILLGFEWAMRKRFHLL